MVKTNITKVVGYVRVSSDSQTDNTSIPEQRERIAAFCVANGWELVKVFADEGKSGSDTKDRAGYNAMMEYVKDPANGITAIVALKADRIHRKLKNLLEMIQDELEPHGIAFISVSERFDTSTAQGMLFLQMLGSFAEFERAIINERTRNGRIRTAKQGRYAGGQVPYGYAVKEGEVVINEEQAAIVRQIFKQYAEGVSYYRIAKDLNARGIRTKSGKQWTIQQVKNVINTETYTGTNTYRGIKQKEVFPRIISRQLWNKIHASKNSLSER
jgi:site-specific DNA recombinase